MAVTGSKGSTGRWTYSSDGIGNPPVNAVWASSTTTLTAGSGLTGGGTLAADRTFNVGAGAGITAQADQIAVSSTISLTAISFTSTTPTATAGNFAYDSADDTLVFYDSYGSPMWLGHTLEIQARNETGSTLSKGTPVYVSGGHSSGLPLISKANASSESTITSTLGLVVEDITDNGFGSVLGHGVLRNFDTSAWTVGTLVYVSTGTAGTLTSTAPTAPNFRWHMGVITKQNGSSGRMAVFSHSEYAAAAAVRFENAATSVLTNGTYTPTVNANANLDALTGYPSWFIQVGTVVTVSGRIDIDPTAPATLTKAWISLPVASLFTASNQCCGTAFASGIAGQGAAIAAGTTGAIMSFVSGDVTNQPMFYQFLYVIR